MATSFNQCYKKKHSESPVHTTYQIYREDGFSLLELVLTISIIFILGTTGVVTYQKYTDNARIATTQSAARQVATAVVNADNSPTEDVLETLEKYNSSTHDLTANITAATTDSMTIVTEDRNSTFGKVTVPGDYSHIPVTQYSAPGITYEWDDLNNPHNSVSHKLLDGKIIATNLVPNPSFEKGVLHYSPGASRIMTGKDWSQSGESSLIHNSIFDRYIGSAYVDIAKFDRDIGLERGKTYTLYAVLRKDHAGDTGSLRFVQGGSDGSAAIETFTDRAPEEAGIHRLRMVFEIPEEQSWWLRLYHRGLEGDPPVFWDDLMILEGDVEMEYFDGDSQ